MSNETLVDGLLATLDEETKKRARRNVEAELLLEKLKLGDDDKERVKVDGDTVEYRRYPSQLSPDAVIRFNPDAARYDRFTTNMATTPLMGHSHLGHAISNIRRVHQQQEEQRSNSARYRELMEGELSRTLLRHINEAGLDVCERGFKDLLDELGATFAAPERTYAVTVSMYVTTDDPDADIDYEVESALEGIEGSHGMEVTVTEDPF